MLLQVELIFFHHAFSQLSIRISFIVTFFTEVILSDGVLGPIGIFFSGYQYTNRIGIIFTAKACRTLDVVKHSCS